MNKPKLYISGAISNMPDLNRTKFANATKLFRDMGFIVVNPHEICHDVPASDWNQCMRRCITALMDCEVILMLDDWKQSKGATVEFDLAGKLNIESYPIDVFYKSVRG